jgi:hypothetical protein
MITPFQKGDACVLSEQNIAMFAVLFIYDAPQEPIFIPNIPSDPGSNEAKIKILQVRNPHSPKPFFI